MNGSRGQRPFVDFFSFGTFFCVDASKRKCWAFVHVCVVGISGFRSFSYTLADECVSLCDRRVRAYSWPSVFCETAHVFRKNGNEQRRQKHIDCLRIVACSQLRIENNAWMWFWCVTLERSRTITTMPMLMVMVVMSMMMENNSAAEAVK